MGRVLPIRCRRPTVTSANPAPKRTEDRALGSGRCVPLGEGVKETVPILVDAAARGRNGR